jgi:hypothetical protein
MQQQLPTLYVLQCLNLSALHEISSALMQQQLLTVCVLQCLNLSELHANLYISHATASNIVVFQGWNP